MADMKLLMNVISLAGRAILENGGETSRAEETCMRISSASGFDEVEVLAVPTGVFVTINSKEENYCTVLKRVKKRTVNLDKICAVNTISRQIAEHKLSLEQAIPQLERILLPSRKQWIFMPICAGLSSGFFAVLFGGVMFDFGIAFLCGALVQIVSISFKRSDLYHFLISLLGGVITAAMAVCAVSLFGMGNLDKIITGAMMPLLPGLAMTNAIRDTMQGDLVSGTARGMEALVKAAAVAVGVGAVMASYAMLGGKI